MAIADRNLTAGTKLWARYKGATYTAEVVAKADDKGNETIAYKLSDGREENERRRRGTSRIAFVSRDGGSARESNPPKTAERPRTDFEDRGWRQPTTRFQEQF